MSFASTLQKIVDQCGGGVAAILMGNDGISIAQVSAADAAGDATEDAMVLGVEFARILDAMRKASDSVQGGAVEEVSVRLARCWVLLRSVDPETLLVVTVAPDGNAAKARFLMRRSLLALREEL